MLVPSWASFHQKIARVFTGLEIATAYRFIVGIANWAPQFHVSLL